MSLRFKRRMSCRPVSDVICAAVYAIHFLIPDYTERIFLHGSLFSEDAKKFQLVDLLKRGSYYCVMDCLLITVSVVTQMNAWV